MRLAKNISFYIILAFVVCLISRYLESDFLFEYLIENIIGLLLTLLAINTATLGLIASKIQDVLEKHPTMSFKNTISEMKFSLTEQVVLITVSVVSLVLSDSEIINFEHKQFALNTVLVSVLIYSVSILWDTGKAVFVILDLIEKQNKK
ncbi:hypothetical protein [Flagellimonas nanhaiensis]|uniref:Uncharacterized protein n=1 Tax=Flagellimonas nanhaiensis TaxID=2292706 RepID=A0A371JP20_9FLAO|nr:hypothetical protein [Allomuricauda nanhaiensis]RDY59264.1 hypothetical protein DX873_07645 [Allomuricauda nanhaiensis]